MDVKISRWNNEEQYEQESLKHLPLKDASQLEWEEQWW